MKMPHKKSIANPPPREQLDFMQLPENKENTLFDVSSECPLINISLTYFACIAGYQVLCEDVDGVYRES
jgi:hypothetical protein